MLSHTFTTLALLTLTTSATPVLLPRQTPTITNSKAIHLQIQPWNGNDEDHLDVIGQYLGAQRISQGVYAAVAAPHPSAPETYSPFYFHAAAAAGQNSTLLNDMGSASPFSLRIQARDEFDASYPGEHSVSMVIDRDGGGTATALGLEVHFTDVYLQGAEAGRYAVCPRTVAGKSVNAVRQVYRGLEDPQDYGEVPEGCLAVKLVPVCAVLNELPEGSEWTHEDVLETMCFEEPF
ncbi:hypothetical protein F4778DRAFT_789715 [Xylariomycetidae sp. FL2044]|nr:hypothetical protein F4778DRAFT_789715 [Xylariomycetidae sp. FL2044]